MSMNLAQLKGKFFALNNAQEIQKPQSIYTLGGPRVKWLHSIPKRQIENDSQWTQ
nr:hypothetical protein [Bartonella vinsonii]